MLIGRLLHMFRVSSKKSLVRLATAALIISAAGTTLLLPSQANAILSTGEFSFNNPGSIQGLKFLYANRQGSDSDFNVDFKGTWPNYQTDTVSWVACPDGKGTSCSSPSGVGHTGMSVNCTGVIKLVVKSDDGTQGELTATESGLGNTSGDSFDCKAAISENATITLKNPIGKATTNRTADRIAREATLTTYCQQLNQAQGAPPAALSGCVATMTTAFNNCYDALGGGNGGTENEVTIDSLAKCMAAPTKAPVEALTAALSGAPPSNIQAGTVNADGAVGDGTTSCRVDGIGWIICPVMKFMAGIVDAAYTVVAALLVVQPILSTGGDTTVFKAWEVMRNIANVAFVIVFLIIIFSQITNVGISNYGIKKMLPRLVAAAILVNISFWICSIAVDLSNIIGGSVNNVFHVVAGQVQAPAQPNSVTDGTGWSSLTETVIAGTVIAAAVLYVTLSALLPALVVALLAIVTVFIVLTVRQALIILLIVVSPLAFVAFLLPNTESLFKKWKALFTTMLLMFPIIGMMFGASALASVVVTQTATQQSNEALKIAVQIMGALIAIVPLVLTPIVMKAAGGVLGKVGAFVNNPNKGPFDRMKKGAEGFAKDRKNVRDINGLNGNRQMLGRGAMTRRGARTNAIRAGRESEVKRANSAYVANQANNPNNQKFANAMAGGTNGLPFTKGVLGSAASPDALARALASAKFTIEKAEVEEVKAASALIEHLDAGALTKILDDNTSSNAVKAASLERLVKTGDPKDYEKYANKYGSDSSEESRVIRNSLSDALSENGPKFLKAGDLDTIRNGKMGATETQADGSTRTNASNLAEVAQTNITAGKYTPERMAGDSAGNIQYAWNNAGTTGKTQMQSTATAIKANDNLKGRINSSTTIDKVESGTL